MILDLARQGLTVSAIARRTGHDRKTVRKYIERGLEPPAYKPREPSPSPLAPFEAFLRERVGRFPDLTGRRLWREIRELGFTGGYATVTDFLRTVRPPVEPVAFERRFETPPGRQAQVDFAHFRVRFEEQPGAERIVWLFSLVLGHSRMMWARFVAQQDLATVLRCHVAAFEALGGVPEQILYDRMRTAVLGEVDQRGIVYNDKLLALAAHYGFVPKACRPYRAKTKGKAALKMDRLLNVKTLAGFDFSFQPSLDRNRILTLAGLDFIDRHEVVHFLGQPGCGKTHLAIALAVEAVKARRSVYFTTLAELIGSLAKAEREGSLRERIRFLCRPQLLVVDEIGYLPVVAGGGNLFFQLVAARYERGAMILTSNRGFAEWGEVFGDTVVATALLDRLLHHAVVVRIEGASYRLRRHADLLPDISAARPMHQPEPAPRRRGRPPKARPADLIATT